MPANARMAEMPSDVVYVYNPKDDSLARVERKRPPLVDPEISRHTQELVEAAQAAAENGAIGCGPSAPELAHIGPIDREVDRHARELAAAGSAAGNGGLVSGPERPYDA